MTIRSDGNGEVAKQEFGNLLKRTREALGLSVAQVAEQTKIPPRYIQLLEDEAFDKLSQPFYVRSYINNLCKFYGVDPMPLLAFYENLSGYSPPNLSPEGYLPLATPMPKKSFSTGLTVGPRRQSSSPHAFWLVGGVLTLATVLLVAAFLSRLFFSSPKDPGDEPPNGDPAPVAISEEVSMERFMYTVPLPLKTLPIPK